MYSKEIMEEEVLYSEFSALKDEFNQIVGCSRQVYMPQPYNQHLIYVVANPMTAAHLIDP